jgi:glycosyltransferase involved in cell wall biosynthesis
MIRVAMIAHLAELSGSGRALVDAAAHLDPGEFQPEIILPAPGDLAAEAARAGVAWSVEPNPEVSLAGAHPLARPGLAARRVGYVWRLARRLRAGRFQLACVNTTASVFAGLAARLARLPVLWRVHEVLDNPSRATRAKMWIVEHLSTGIMYDSATGERCFPAPRVPHRLVMRNHVNPKAFGPWRRKPETVASLGIQPGETVIVANGPFPRKGADVFLAAAATVTGRSERPLRFVLLGPETPEHADFCRRLRAEADRPPLRGRVTFAGLRRDVADILACSDIFVSPSRNEAWPIIILEAMATGLPVVATRVGDCADMLDGGRRGLLVPPGDAQALAGAIEQIIAQPEEARKRAQAATEWISQTFGTPDYWHPLEQLIRRVAAS